MHPRGGREFVWGLAPPSVRVDWSFLLTEGGLGELNMSKTRLRPAHVRCGHGSEQYTASFHHPHNISLRRTVELALVLLHFSPLSYPGGLWSRHRFRKAAEIPRWIMGCIGDQNLIGGRETQFGPRITAMDWRRARRGELLDKYTRAVL